MADSWWNTSYSLRRSLEIVNAFETPIPENNPVYAILSLSQMISLNKIRDDYDDIEVLFYDDQGATPTWTQLPRVVSEGGNDTLVIAFNTVYEIDEEDTSHYYLYYTNPSLKNQYLTCYHQMDK